MKILIADDHPLFRRGLVDFLKNYPDIDVVAESSNGEEVLDFLKTTEVDVVLLDINMPEYDGFELLAIIRQFRKPIKVIFLTMYDNLVYARRAYELGADGYLLKDDAEKLIIDCLQSAAKNEFYCSLGNIDELIKKGDQALLSPAEKRVLNLVGTGKSSIEISDMLCISVRTVEKHRAHIAEKLDLKGANALLKYALQHRIVDE